MHFHAIIFPSILTLLSQDNNLCNMNNISPNRILDLASAFYDSCVMFAASDAGIFKALSELKSADCGTISKKCGLDQRAARLILDACVAIKLITKECDNYSNTPETATFLVPGTPGDLSKAIRYNRDVYPAWGKLTEFIKTGKPVEKPEIHLGENKDRTRAFVLSMHGRAMGIGRAVVPNLDLKGRKKLLDVGGGPGTYSVLIAQANPQLECTVIDLPGVVEIANELIKDQNMQNRVKTIPGSYHTTEFPGGVDVVNFFGVLHQESPEAIKKLFSKAYAALVPGGIVNVVDMMTDATHTEPKFSALFAVNMALTTQNGWVFSDNELKSWLTGAGFRDFQCKPLPPPMPHWIATAKKQG